MPECADTEKPSHEGTGEKTMEILSSNCNCVEKTLPHDDGGLRETMIMNNTDVVLYLSSYRSTVIRWWCDDDDDFDDDVEYGSLSPVPLPTTINSFCYKSSCIIVLVTSIGCATGCYNSWIAIFVVTVSELHNFFQTVFNRLSFLIVP